MPQHSKEQVFIAQDGSFMSVAVGLTEVLPVKRGGKARTVTVPPYFVVKINWIDGPNTRIVGRDLMGCLLTLLRCGV